MFDARGTAGGHWTPAGAESPKFRNVEDSKMFGNRKKGPKIGPHGPYRPDIKIDIEQMNTNVVFRWTWDPSRGPMTSN